MKPWDVEETRKKLNKLSSTRSVQIFFDLQHAAFKIIKASLEDENPHLSAAEIKIKINQLAESLGKL